MNTLEILDRLIGFPTLSRTPNVELIDFVTSLLGDTGARITRLENEDGSRANLYASIGPGDGGVMLSGHTDVVPVEGQDWSRPPFKLTEAEGRLYGRGTGL